MAYMEKLREGTLADAIEKFALQSQQHSAMAADGEEAWDQSSLARPSLSDFLRDDQPGVIASPPRAPPSPPPLRELAEMNAPGSRQPEELGLGDRKDSESVPGVCGLLNMGNTCYMNAGLQCIRSIPEITNHFLNVMDSISESKSSGKSVLSSRFATLIQKIWSGLFSAVHPKAFKITLGLLHPQFNGNRQQDCQEFLAMLLDTLHEDCVSRVTKSQSLENDTNSMESTDGRRQSDQTSDGGRDRGCSTTSVSSPSCAESGSVITDTFRGMLKNEVVCQKCGHKSTKEEPFFYLSVSLPHAFERQIYVKWMPLCSSPGHRKSVRLLVTVLKVTTVAVFKDALVNLIGRSLSHDLIQIAEIKENSIVRILADSVALKQLDDKSCEIFAFELSPLLSLASSLPPSDLEMERGGGGGGGGGEKGEDRGGGEGERGEGEMAEEVSVSSRKHGKESDSETEGLPTKMFKRDKHLPSREGESPSAPVINPTNNEHQHMASSDNDDNVTDENCQKGVAPVVSKAVVVEWHSCAICLEEMVDDELVTHTACGAILCPTCLQSSVDHYQKEDGLVPCPICSKVVKAAEAFTPLAVSSEAGEHLIKLLQTTILFRTLTPEGLPQCIAPPAILRLPETATSKEYHHLISLLLPPSLSSEPTDGGDTWNLCLTDAKGRFCSRCVYGSGCRGCVLSPTATDRTSLKPGDFLAVTLLSNRGGGVGGGEKEEGEEIKLCEFVDSHPSMATKRGSILSLEECLSVFSQREELAGDNHWFCPLCDEFQPATRILSVSSLPQTLIVHLKRFVYHGTAGSKVDSPVNFPLELDPRLVSHDCHMTSPLQLSACVCHFGTLNSGHYTAYVRHMITGEWTYCNDESVSSSTPSEKDSSSVYILFYRRRDLPVPTLPAVNKTFNDDLEMSSVDRLLRQHKPRPSGTQQPSPRPKRSNSASDISSVTETSDSNITATANQLLASLGINPGTATIAHALPTVSSITLSEGPPRSPPPPCTSSVLLTPPPSNSSASPRATPQTTPIMDDYMNYDFSEDAVVMPTTATAEAVENRRNILPLAERDKDW